MTIACVVVANKLTDHKMTKRAYAARCISAIDRGDTLALYLTFAYSTNVEITSIDFREIAGTVASAAG